MRIIAGKWGGQRIEAPAGRASRPTLDRVREAWMSTIAPYLPDAQVLDLFAGSGALGIEALSRGAAHVTFVEQAAAAVRVLRRNLERLDVPLEQIRIVRGDALRFLEELPREGGPNYDLAFADPPYGAGVAPQILERFRTHPFAALLGIEHARQEALNDPEARQRRYGDTVLSFLSAD